MAGDVYEVLVRIHRDNTNSRLLVIPPLCPSISKDNLNQEKILKDLLRLINYTIATRCWIPNVARWETDISDYLAKR